MNSLWSVRSHRSLVIGLFLAVVCLSHGLPQVFAADPVQAPPAQPADPTAPRDPSEHGVGPNCRAEVKKLCAGIRPGGGRIKKCIQDNETKLSPACQKAVQERLEKEGSQKQ